MNVGMGVSTRLDTKAPRSPRLGKWPSERKSAGQHASLASLVARTMMLPLDYSAFAVASEAGVSRGARPMPGVKGLQMLHLKPGNRFDPHPAGHRS